MVGLFQNVLDFKQGLGSFSSALAEKELYLEAISLGGINIADIVKTSGKSKQASGMIKEYLKNKGIKTNDNLYETRPTEDIDLLLINQEIVDELMLKGYIPQPAGFRIEIDCGRVIDLMQGITNTHLNDLYFEEYKFFRKIFSDDHLQVYSPPPGEVYADKFSLAQGNNKHAFDKRLLESVLTSRVINNSKRIHELEEY